jgi:hypothetical protein
MKFNVFKKIYFFFFFFFFAAFFNAEEKKLIIIQNLMFILECLILVMIKKINFNWISTSK